MKSRVTRFSRELASDIRSSLATRKEEGQPRVEPIVVTMFVFVLGWLVLSVAFSPSIDRDHHFGEDGAVTALSATLLAGAASFALGTFVVSHRGGLRRIVPWLLISVGFALLALDELMMFHEEFGTFIDERVSSGSFRNWNDIIVIVYGFLAIGGAALFLPTLLRYRLVGELLGIAFLFYVIHTVIDSTQEPRTTTSKILEESAKLVSVSFLALAMLTAFLAAIWTLLPRGVPNTTPSDASL